MDVHVSIVRHNTGLVDIRLLSAGRDDIYRERSEISDIKNLT